MANAADIVVARDAGAELLSMKDRRTRDKFNGSQEGWDAWIFPVEADMDSLGWLGLRVAARDAADTLEIPMMGPVAVVTGRNLYLWLSQRCGGKALTIVKLVSDLDGWEVWRLLNKEYAPVGDTSVHSMLSTIIQPKRWSKTPHVNRPFMEVLLDWEQLIQRYELAANERISETIR